MIQPADSSRPCGVHACLSFCTELSITGTQKEIEELKVQLEKERILRQQKEEYEAISRLINELPPRAETEE